MKAKKRPTPSGTYRTRDLVAEELAAPIIPRLRKRVYRRRDIRAKS